MRTRKPKFFLLSGKFEIAVVIKADSKDEAIAYSQDAFARHVVVDTVGYDGMIVVANKPIKLRKPRRVNPDALPTDDSI